MSRPRASKTIVRARIEEPYSSRFGARVWRQAVVPITKAGDNNRAWLALNLVDLPLKGDLRSVGPCHPRP